MNDLSHLTKLQRLVLAILEEAGEEDIAALTNTLHRQRCGSSHEVEAMVPALSGLINDDLIRFASSRDPVSFQLIDWSKNDSLVLARALKSSLDWSPDEQIWKWNSELSRAEVVMTKAGGAAARQVLSEDGWPAELSH
jgi:hypothetical protein